jgi:hypothetical protein
MVESFRNGSQRWRSFSREPFVKLPPNIIGLTGAFGSGCTTATDWKYQRNRRKFDVYINKHKGEPPARPDRWVN